MFRFRVGKGAARHGVAPCQREVVSARQCALGRGPSAAYAPRMAGASDEPRLILITGVSRGLGRALVEEFARRGHTVQGCARDAGAIAELGRHHGPPYDFGSAAAYPAPEEWARTAAPFLLGLDSKHNGKPLTVG